MGCNTLRSGSRRTRHGWKPVVPGPDLKTEAWEEAYVGCSWVPRASSLWVCRGGRVSSAAIRRSRTKIGGSSCRGRFARPTLKSVFAEFGWEGCPTCVSGRRISGEIGRSQSSLTTRHGQEGPDRLSRSFTKTSATPGSECALVEKHPRGKSLSAEKPPGDRKNRQSSTNRELIPQIAIGFDRRRARFELTCTLDCSWVRSAKMREPLFKARLISIAEGAFRRMWLFARGVNRTPGPTRNGSSSLKMKLGSFGAGDSG